MEVHAKSSSRSQLQRWMHIYGLMQRGMHIQGLMQRGVHVQYKAKGEG